jgi:hypothetical protein
MVRGDIKTQVSNRVNGALISQYDYQYDAIGRRTSVKNSGSAFSASAFTKWGYDERNQLTNSDRYLGTNLEVTTSPVAAQYRSYDYDPIGNRQTSMFGTTATSYTPNRLNQYDFVGQQAPSYDEDGRPWHAS